MARLSTLALFLLGLSVARLASADEPATPAPSTEQQIHETVERAIGYQQAESAKWMSTRQCAACHHLPMVLWSLNEAEHSGYLIDKKYVAEMADSTFGKLADGSWPMTSRSTPDGSPGSSTLLTPIQCATSSWVVLALSRLVPHGP